MSCATRPARAARSTSRLKLVAPDGQVIKVGWSPDQVPVDLNPLVQKNVRLQGSFSHNYPIWERVIHLLDQGLTKADLIVGLKTNLGRLARRVRRDALGTGHQVGADPVTLGFTGSRVQ